MERHPDNPNRILVYGGEWQCLPLLERQSPFIEEYLAINRAVMFRAFSRAKGCLVILFELRFPYAYACPEHGLITDFFRRLKEQIKANVKARALRRGRMLDDRMDYIWARERKEALHSHYHVAIFLDLAVYNGLGSLDLAISQHSEYNLSPIVPAMASMAGRINRAWARAIGVPEASAVGLVHYPDNAVYRIATGDTDFVYSFLGLFRRLSYFAKSRTKDFTARGEPDWYGASRAPRPVFSYSRPLSHE